MKSLGVRQRRMLVDFHRVGGGGWPRGWRLSYDHKTTLSSLHRLELITRPDREARLTSAGHLMAASLAGELVP